MRVTRYPKIRERLAPALAGRLINALRDIAVVVRDLPIVSNADGDTDLDGLGLRLFPDLDGE